MVVLTLKAKNDHLQKVAKTSDFVKALAELVWNSLDADATEVNVIFSLNALGGIDSIVVTDNGSGISKERAEHDFESLGRFVETHDTQNMYAWSCYSRQRRARPVT